jgi:hypothetical protein
MRASAATSPRGRSRDRTRNPAEHHYGTIPLVLRALLDHHVRADPNDSPRLDTTTVRKTWAYYPLLLS